MNRQELTIRQRLAAYKTERHRIVHGYELAQRAWLARAERGIWTPQPEAPVIPPMPEDLKGVRCGARTRHGKPCKQTELFPNGRCKFHGGMSTGPKSAEGRARALANLTRPSAGYVP